MPAPWMSWRKQRSSKPESESNIAPSCRNHPTTSLSSGSSCSTTHTTTPTTITFVPAAGSSALTLLHNNGYGKRRSSSPQHLKKSCRRGGAVATAGNSAAPSYICCNNLKGVVHGNTRVVHRADNVDSPVSHSSAAAAALVRPSSKSLNGEDNCDRASGNDSVVRTRASTPELLRHQHSRYHHHSLQPARHSFSHLPSSSSSSSSSTAATSTSYGGKSYGCCGGGAELQSGDCYVHIQQIQSPYHSVRELGEGDSARSIVEIIFQASWGAAATAEEVRIESIYKVSSSSRAMARFEEQRDMVKAKASKNLINAAAKKSSSSSSSRCMVDGNEVLRFHATAAATACCSLVGGTAPLCSDSAPSCGLCSILRHGFIPSPAGIHTNASSGRAHCRAQGGGVAGNGRCAMLVCRVIAGRVKRMAASADVREIGSRSQLIEGSVYDSVAGGGGGEAAQFGGGTDMDDLVVFNPRAVLPCFVVLYTLSS